MCPQYSSKVYKTSNQSNTVIRNYPLKPFQPLRTKTQSQKCLSYFGSLVWNGLPDDAEQSEYV